MTNENRLIYFKTDIAEYLKTTYFIHHEFSNSLKNLITY